MQILQMMKEQKHKKSILVQTEEDKNRESMEEDLNLKNPKDLVQEISKLDKYQENQSNNNKEIYKYVKEKEKNKNNNAKDNVKDKENVKDREKDNNLINRKIINNSMKDIKNTNCLHILINNNPILQDNNEEVNNKEDKVINITRTILTSLNNPNVIKIYCLLL